MYYSLSYASRAVAGLAPEDLENIVKTAVEHNQKTNITGILFYHQDRFFQYIEGDREDVVALMAKIMCDKRHYYILIRSRCEIKERFFPNWSMKCKNLTDAEKNMLGETFSWDKLVNPEGDTQVHKFIMNSILLKAQKILARA